MTQEEIRAKEEARLEAERSRLEDERRKAEEAKLAPSLKNSIGMELILIKPGEFLMGGDMTADEKPIHKVVITRPFYMGKYEVTQAQWRAVMGNSPSHFVGDDLPVERVSFDDAKKFCSKLSQMSGEEYRLPTEAEWEYSARAGTTGTYAGNLDSMAWYRDNSGMRSHAVGTKQPNAWGLYDMHGNVWEWCEDWYGERYYSLSPATDPRGPSVSSLLSTRVVRGGYWDSYAARCGSGHRAPSSPGDRDDSCGFRLLRTAK